MEGWVVLSNCILGFATFLLALATVMVVLGDSIRDKIGQRPELALSVGNSKGELVDDRGTPPRWTRYYHVRLTNQRGRWPAENARVEIVRLWKESESGDLIGIPQSGPLQLEWQGTHPLYRTVGPGVVVCNLCRVRQDEGLFLLPIFTPTPFGGVLNSRGILHVMLQAVSDKYESTPLTIRIEWDGEWSKGDDEMANHLRITTLN